jgi:hypothetical protein
MKPADFPGNWTDVNPGDSAPTALIDELALELLRAARELCTRNCGKSGTSHTFGCQTRSRAILRYDDQKAAEAKAEERCYVCGGENMDLWRKF